VCVSGAQRRLAQELNACKAESSAEREKLKEAHRLALAATTKKHDTALHEAASALARHKADAADALSAAEAGCAERLREAERAAEGRVESLAKCLREAEQKKEAAAAAYSQLQERLSASERARRDEREEAAARAAETASRNDKASATLVTEFEAVQQKMRDRYAKLQAFARELEYKYANRESRQEDVDAINELRAQVRFRDDALLHAKVDLQSVQLELENRETSFNKMFGRQPTVNAAADRDVAAAPEYDPRMRPSSVPPPSDHGWFSDPASTRRGAPALGLGKRNSSGGPPLPVAPPAAQRWPRLPPSGP